MTRTALMLMVVAAVLVGCSAAPTVEATPSAEPTVETSAAPLIESLDAVSGTRWIAKDSQGDTTYVSFDDDGGVSYSTEGQHFDYAEDTWSVDGDVLTSQVTYGARFGVWTCTGTLDVETQEIVATWTSTVGESGTVDLRQSVR